MGGVRGRQHISLAHRFSDKKTPTQESVSKALPHRRPDLHDKVLDLKLMSPQEETLGSKGRDRALCKWEDFPRGKTLFKTQSQII